MENLTRIRQPNEKLLKVEAIPSRWVLRLRALKRIAIWHTASRVLPVYLVTEFPKSGGTWYSQMLAECLDLPFARNNNPAKFESSVMHGVFVYSRNFHNVSVVMRDGRDVMVSAYYHFLFKNNANIHFAVDKKRKLLGFTDIDDIRSNLPKFIEYMFTEFPRSLGYRCSWASFVDSWEGKNVCLIKYEDLLNDGVGTMTRAVYELTGNEVDRDKIQAIVSAYSFRNLTGRKPGQVEKGNFIRKGIAGDWKNQFTMQSREVFHKYAGQHLIKLGYEASDGWVDQSYPADNP